MADRPPRARFEELVEVMHRLRTGCPWDREQTWGSLRPYVLEEAYEVVDALDRAVEAGRGESDREPAVVTGAQKELPSSPAREAARKVADEAGDLLFQVVFLAEIAAEKGWFDVDEVVGGIREKLVRRHPHVFGEVQAETADDVVRNWEAIKAGERAVEGSTSALDGVPKALPALVRAEKLGKRAARAGFDWRSAEAVLDKVEEELAEVRGALAKGDRAGAARELGDLLFAAAQAARFLDVNPEEAARGATATFEARFRRLERELAAEGKRPADVDDAELDRRWEAAKRALREGTG